MPRVYCMPRTRSNRVLWLLEEIGQPYELTRILPEQRRSEAHLARHPLGRVPAVELDDGTVMFESAAICLQLADLAPEAGLLAPSGSAMRALAYQWTLFGMTELEVPLYRWIGALRDQRDDNASRERFLSAAGVLSDALGEKEWLLGEGLSVPDIVCIGVLGSAHSRQLLGDWPVLQAYVERGESRPAHARAVRAAAAE
jgi:glutathione S-transferase